MIATNFPRRLSICFAQRTIGSLGRLINAAHAACVITRRNELEPAFVMPVRRCFSELDFSPGVSPKYDCNR